MTFNLQDILQQENDFLSENCFVNHDMKFFPRENLNQVQIWETIDKLVNNDLLRKIKSYCGVRNIMNRVTLNRKTRQEMNETDRK